MRQLLLNLPNYVQSSPFTLPKTFDKIIEFREYIEDSVYDHISNVSPEFGKERQAFYGNSMDVFNERQKEGENSSVEYRIIKHLPFSVGESLMINHALQITSHNPTLIPFTDDPIHDKFLRWKHQHITKPKVTRSLLHEADMISDFKQNITALHVMNMELPDMANVPMEEIIKLRRYRKPELEAFRVKMNSLATSIETNYWDKSYANEVKMRYNSEIQKELINLRTSIQSLKGDRWKWITGTVGSGISMSSIPLVFSVLPAMPVALILAATSGIYALEKYLEHRKKKNELRRNGVVFLFRLNELTNRFA